MYNSISFSEGIERIRDCDVKGCGHYGSSRSHGIHKGIDIIKYEGEQIKAPFDCIVVRHGQVYKDSTHYKLVVIRGLGKWSNYTMKIMYIRSLVSPNTQLKKGDVLGQAQDISKRYKGITKHIHVELFKNNTLINPKSYIYTKKVPSTIININSKTDRINTFNLFAITLGVFALSYVIYGQYTNTKTQQ